MSTQDALYPTLRAIIALTNAVAAQQALLMRLRSSGASKEDIESLEKVSAALNDVSARVDDAVARLGRP